MTTKMNTLKATCRCGATLEIYGTTQLNNMYDKFLKKHENCTLNNQTVDVVDAADNT